jgi:hypothetical protein
MENTGILRSTRLSGHHSETAAGLRDVHSQNGDYASFIAVSEYQPMDQCPSYFKKLFILGWCIMEMLETLQ